MRRKQLLCLLLAVIACSQAIAGDSLPKYTMALFNDTTCPAGWLLQPGLEGLFLMPTTDDTEVGVQAGYPIRMRTDLEDPTHAHTIETQFFLPSIEFAIVAGCCNDSVASQGTFTATGTSVQASPELPMRSQLICEKVSDPDPAAPPMPSDSLALLDSTSCPSGWHIANDDINGRYLVGTPDGGTANATFGAATLEAGQLPKHTHPFTAGFYAPSPGVAAASGCCTSGWAPSQNYAATGTSAQSTTEFPYRLLLACIKS